MSTTRKFRFFLKNLGGSDAVTKDNIQICFTMQSQVQLFMGFFKKNAKIQLVMML